MLYGPVLLCIIVLGGVRCYQLLHSRTPVDPAQRASCRYRIGYGIRMLVSLVNALVPLMMLNALLVTKTQADFEVVSMSAQVVCWAFLMVLAHLEFARFTGKARGDRDAIGGRLGNGNWILRFLWIFALAAQSVKLPTVRALAELEDRGYFYVASLVAWAALAVLVITTYLSLFGEPRPEPVEGEPAEEGEAAADGAAGAAAAAAAAAAGKGDAAEHPSVSANCASRWTYAWLNPMLKLGIKRPLEAGDVAAIPSAYTALAAKEKFAAAWASERARFEAAQKAAALKRRNAPKKKKDAKKKKGGKKKRAKGKGKKGKKKRAATAPKAGAGKKADGKGAAAAADKDETPSLVKALRAAFGWQIALSGLPRAAALVLQFVQPVLLPKLMAFATDKDKRDEEGYMWALLLAACAAMSAIFNAKYQNQIALIVVEMKSALISTVYAKALRMGNAARQERSVGSIVNYIGSARRDSAEHFFRSSAYSSAQLRPGSSFLRSALRFLDRTPTASLGSSGSSTCCGRRRFRSSWR